MHGDLHTCDLCLHGPPANWPSCVLSVPGVSPHPSARLASPAGEGRPGGGHQPALGDPTRHEGFRKCRSPCARFS